MMNRNELFEPGRYSSLPDVILRDPSLSASAKLVWMALAGHLGPSGTEVWPSMTRLSRMTGLGKNTVLRAVAALEDANLIVVKRQPSGKANLYRILQPQVGLFDEKSAANQSEKLTGRENPPVEKPDPKQSQNGTGAEMGPVPKCDPTSPKMGPEAVPKWDSKYCSSTERSTPPTPKGEKEKSEGNGFSPKPKTKKQIVQQCETAHQKAFGKPLPAKWKRDIRLEYDDGDFAALERIDEAVMAEAEKYRAAKRWSCLGHGTVMQYLAHLDRKATAKHKKSADTQAQAAEQAEKDELEQCRLEHFRGLGQAQQEQHVAEVRRRFPHMKDLDMIGRQAANAAWLEYERTPVEV